MKHFASTSIGLLLVLGSQVPLHGCAPSGDSQVDGAGGSTVASGGSSFGTGGMGSGGLGSGGTGTGGSGMSSGGAGTGGAGASSGGAGTGGAEPIAATFETVEFVIHATPCAGSDCHGHPGNDLQMVDEQGNILEGQAMHDRLLSDISEKCNNMPVVTPGEPENSALVQLLKGPCGELPQMPDGCSPDQGNCLPAEYVQAIEDWVLAGAPL